ncbi:MAG: hypothetical protein ABIH69_04775 [bacterium]|nr:hypothetical protein [Candidatus Margulisiibacteriota bacterium]
MSELCISRAYLVKNKAFSIEQVGPILAPRGSDIIRLDNKNSIRQLAKDLEIGTWSSRPIWVCLIDNMALVAPEQENNQLFEKALQPCLGEKGVLIDLFYTRESIDRFYLLFKNEKDGIVQQEVSFKPSVLSLDQMAQLMTLGTAPFYKITLECVGSMGSFSLYGFLKHYDGDKTILPLCNNLGKYVSEPIKESEVDDVRFISHWEQIYPIFVELY